MVFGDLDQFRKEILQHHNEKRAKHNSPPLTLDDTLNKFAQGWVEQCSKENNFRHRSDEDRTWEDGRIWIGENGYWCQNGDPTPENATNAWYREVDDYSYDKPVFSPETGHFTQVIWKSTTKMGVGVIQDPNNEKWYVIVNYMPGGNIPNQFKENIDPPQ